MDDTVRIYNPKLNEQHIEKIKESLPIYSKEIITKENPKKVSSRVITMKETIDEYEQKIRNTVFRHPGFNIMYNWLIAGLMLAIIVECVIWGLDIRTNRMAEALTVQAMAEYQAEQDAAAKAEAERLETIARSEANIMKNEAEYGAKLIYGIRNFIDKYGYSEKDLRTYIRCACDRVDYGGKTNTFGEIASQEQQFLGYFDTNPILDEYYKIAYSEIETWHHETTKPWDVSYRFAELTPTGIFLTNEFGADGYARRVRY